MIYRKRIQDQARVSMEQYPLMTTSCSGCGATLVFEQDEAISSCDFCGKKLVRKKYTHSKDVPEGIIPFAVTQAEAVEKIKQWCDKNKKKKEAKHLLELADQLKGYYLPYQMVRGPVSCQVNKKNNVTKFEASGYLHQEFINCSSQLDNLVLDAMEPYDLTGLKEFDYAYVAGQKVKITDINEEKKTQRLLEEVDKNYRIFLEKIWGTKAIEIEADVETTMQCPVLLPVYYIKQGEISAAVNGQTGKVSVQAEKVSRYISLPWWLEAILLFIVSAGALFGIAYLASGSVRESLFYTGIAAFFYLFIFCFMFDPGLDNTGSITYYRNIFTSGRQTFRREKGKLVPNAEDLKRSISEPVFRKNIHGTDTMVTYIFRSKIRIISMILLTIGGVFLPVILALFVNGFDFGRLKLGGSAVWFCITVPTAPILLIQLGIKELYNNPWVYTLSEDGKKKRYHESSSQHPVKDTLILLLGLCLHPLGWLVIGSIAVMVYLTAFGF